MIVPVLDIKPNIPKQIAKCKEELEEILDAIANNESEERIIEEAIDSFQANVTLLDMILKTNEQLEDSFRKHRNKMVERGHGIKCYWIAERL